MKGPVIMLYNTAQLIDYVYSPEQAAEEVSMSERFKNG